MAQHHSRTSKLSILIAGLLLGAGLVLAFRFFNYKSQHTHYHANFALYVNGEREQFAGPGYYEEVTACTAGTDNDPKHRSHMHGNINDVVHVHAEGVTWSQFLENIGVVVTPESVYVGGKNYAEAAHQTRFILNGEPVTNLESKIVKSEDRLLIDYEPASESQPSVTDRYTKVAQSAATYNKQPDPASCKGDEPATWQERLEHLL